MKNVLLILLSMLVASCAFASQPGWALGPLKLGQSLESIEGFLNVKADDAGCKIISLEREHPSLGLVNVSGNVELVFHKIKGNWKLALLAIDVEEPEALKAALSKLYGAAQNLGSSEWGWKHRGRTLKLTNKAGPMLEYEIDGFKCPS
jgi:hypothetical protein